MIKENELLDISNKEYHSGGEYYSSSQLKDALEGRTHFYNKHLAKITKKQESSAFDVGTAAHTLLLEPELYDTEVLIYKSRGKGDTIKLFRLDNPDKTVISNIQDCQVRQWIKIVKKNKLAMKYFTGGIAEKSVYTTLNGKKCKARFDYMNVEEGFISDLKTTTGKLTEDSIRSKVLQWSYHLSSAFYLDIMNKVCNNKLTDFVLVFFSKDTFQIKVVKLDKSMIEEGRQMYKKALEEIEIITHKDFICREEVLILKSNNIGEW